MTKHKCPGCNNVLATLKVERGLLNIVDPKTPRKYCVNCDKVFKIELVEEG